MPTVNIPGVGRVNFPDGMPLPEIQQAVARLSIEAGVQAAPGASEHEAEMAELRRMAFGSSRPSTHTPRRPVSLPFGLGEFTVGGRVAEAANAASSIPLETSLPLTAATVGSMAAGPVGGTVARGLAARLVANAAKPALGAAAGGAAAGGALEAQDPNATAGSIAREALTTGGEMAAAELVGAGIGGLASKVVAPNLRFLDPLAPARRHLSEVIRELPDHARAAVRRVEELLPEGATASARNAGESLRSAAQQANEAFRKLVSAETRTVKLPNARVTAERAARAIGAERARRFGFNAESVGPRAFISRVLESGDAPAIETLKKRLGESSLNDALSLHLAQMIERATVKASGRRVLDGERLMAAWRELPDATRALYDRSTQQAIESLATFGTTLTRLGRFAASPTGGELIEAAAMPAIMATFGAGVGVPLFLAKALLNPGPAVRYLTRDQLPNEVVQVIGGQTVRTGLRGNLLDDDEE